MAPPKRTKAEIARGEAYDLGEHHGKFGTYLLPEGYNRAQMKAYDSGYTSGQKRPCRF